MSMFNKIKNAKQPELFDDTDTAVIEREEDTPVAESTELADTQPETDFVESVSVDGGVDQDLDDDGGDAPPPFDLNNIFSDGEGGEEAEIAKFAEKAYLEYAMSMVKGR